MDYQYKVDHALIATRIKAARKQAGLTQEQLAEKIDISTNAVAKLENRLMSASLQTLVNICNTLHLDFNYLLCEDYGTREDTDRSVFLEHLFRTLSPREQDFIIYVMNGLKIYDADE